MVSLCGYKRVQLGINFSLLLGIFFVLQVQALEE